MAIKKLVAISYCFAFLFVYFASISYTFISQGVNEEYNTNLPQTMAMNATVNAVSAMSITPNWIMLGAIVLIVAILLIIISSRAMGAAI